MTKVNSFCLVSLLSFVWCIFHSKPCVNNWSERKVGRRRRWGLLRCESPLSSPPFPPFLRWCCYCAGLWEREVPGCRVVPTNPGRSRVARRLGKEKTTSMARKFFRGKIRLINFLYVFVRDWSLKNNLKHLQHLAGFRELLKHTFCPFLRR